MNGLDVAPILETDSNFERNDPPMNDSVDLVDSGRTFKCSHSGCSATFSKPSKLTIHIRQHTGERPYKCDYDSCDKSYTNPSHLKRHCQTHNIIKELFKCPECSLMISSRQNLKRHYERVHSENSPYFCKECCLKFNKEQKYKEHLAIHDGVALYNCKICFRRCSTLSTFKKHERSHDNEKEYPCTAPNCSEVFQKWSLLCKHKNSKHINEYKCKDCDKVFLNKAQLKSHYVVHTDNRSILPCPYEKCPRFYFFKRNLDHHVRTSHLGKKYHCDICDMKLSSKQKIVEHIKKIHLVKKKKKKTLGKSERRRRRDAGTSKKSMLTQLAGLDLPNDIEKELLNRKTRIQINQEDPTQNLEKIHETGKEMEVVGQIFTNIYKNATNNDTDHLSVVNVADNQTINESFDQIDKRHVITS